MPFHCVRIKGSLSLVWTLKAIYEMSPILVVSTTMGTGCTFYAILLSEFRKKRMERKLAKYVKCWHQENHARWIVSQ